MPPRIIRDSDRPGASNRTMITQRSFSLAQSVELDRACCHRQRRPKKETVPSKPRSKSGCSYRQWAGERDPNPLVLRSRQKFFLDFPFHRTHRSPRPSLDPASFLPAHTRAPALLPCLPRSLARPAQPTSPHEHGRVHFAIGIYLPPTPVCCPSVAHLYFTFALRSLQ